MIGPPASQPRGARIGRAIDRALAVVAPGLARRRMENRVRFHFAGVHEAMAYTYAAAEKSRLTTDWPAKSVSADAAYMPDARTVMARARAAVRDDWIATSGVSAYRRHVVGTGISVRAAARDAAGKPLKEFNDAVDAWWDRWGRSPAACDAEGRKTEVELQGLAVQEWATVGEALAVLSYQAQPDNVGLMVQCFEPEQLAWDLTRHPETNNDIRGGVEVDAAGRAVAYHVCMDGYVTDLHRYRRSSSLYERIPASRVLQLMRQDRPRQTHGLSRLSTVLNRLRHLAMYDEWEVVAKRMEACIGISRKPDPADGAGLPALMPPTAADAKDSRLNPQLRFEPGMVLPYEVSLINPQRPGANYDPFMTRQIGEAAAGMDLDYPTVSRDFSKATYGGQRQGVLERDKVTDPVQLLLVDQWIRPIHDLFVMLLLSENRVAAPKGFWTDAAVRAACMELDWQPPAKPWIDPAREMAAAKIAVDYRFITRGILARQSQENAKQLLATTAEELDEAERLRVPLPDGRPGNRTAAPVSPNEPRPVRDDTATDDEEEAPGTPGDDEKRRRSTDALALALVSERID
jgi:lambda family phage portal protein